MTSPLKYTKDQCKVYTARYYQNGRVSYHKQFYWRVRLDGKVVNTFLTIGAANRWIKKQVTQS